ncbi:DNA replication/repair protein RecF [soil metagenome]
MIVSLRLQNYRSYTDDSFEFDPSINIVVGPNASGKTNLLEAILLSCTGKSYRGGDEELVMHNEPWARIDTQTDTSHRVVKLRRQTPRLQKSFELDRVALSRLLPPKQLPVVLFEPNHLLMLHGGPDMRREYMDSLIERTVPGYAKLRRDYKRALYQRNTLLKNGITQYDTMFVWNVRLSEIGGSIVWERSRLIDTISAQIDALYGQISGSKNTLIIQYKSQCDVRSYSSELLKKLEQNTEKDVQRGFTSYGPHRDDVDVSLDNHPAKDVASRGEVRTIILALKVIEMQLLEASAQKKPILLLDDVFSELDGARRKHLTDFLEDHQTFITTTDADIVVQHFMTKCHIIPVSKS